MTLKRGDAQSSNVGAKESHGSLYNLYICFNNQFQCFRLARQEAVEETSL